MVPVPMPPPQPRAAEWPTAARRAARDRPEVPPPVVDLLLMQTAAPAVPFGKLHARRLREILTARPVRLRQHVEVELLAGGSERVRTPHGHETLRVTDGRHGPHRDHVTVNRAALSPHEAGGARWAREMTRGGRHRGAARPARAPAADSRGRRAGAARPDRAPI